MKVYYKIVELTVEACSTEVKEKTIKRNLSASRAQELCYRLNDKVAMGDMEIDSMISYIWVRQSSFPELTHSPQVVW